MLDSHGFDLWADNYDKTVNLADDGSQYPFAGYRPLMNLIYGTVMNKKPANVLDIGIGTGVLACKLYDGGNRITGIDFSKAMLEKAKEKMPNATLIECDFSRGLPNEILDKTYDFIVSTYAMHHLADADKIPFILSTLKLLRDDGLIIIGDVSFQNRDDLEMCRTANSSAWDDDEFYFVVSELYKALNGKCNINYHQISHCSGILEISSVSAGSDVG